MTAIEAANPAKTAPTISLPHHRLVLTGFMGAGKTTIGRILAERLGWTFLDLDQHLEARAGATVAELFSNHGESHFRRLESSALASALANENVVIALGGGTPEQLTNRLLLEQTPGTFVVFLEASFSILFDRCMLQGLAAPAHARPVLADPASAAERFQLRQPLYRRLARLTLDVQQGTPAEIAAALLDQL